MESREVQQTYHLLYDTLHDAGEGSPVTWLYVGTEYGAFLGYQKKPEFSVQWNKSHPLVLAPSPGAAAPAAEATGMEARSGYVALGCEGHRPSLNSTRAAYYTRERGWYKAYRGTALRSAWYGPYVFSDGVTLGLTATRRLYNSTGAFVGVCGADLTLAGVADFITSDQMQASPNMRSGQCAPVLTRGDLPGPVRTRDPPPRDGYEGRVKAGAAGAKWRVHT